MSESDIRQVLSNVLMEFPVKEIKVNIPRWILSLEQGHWLKSALYDAICRSCGQLHRISHVAAQLEQIENVSRSSAHRLPVWIWDTAR